MTRIPNDAVPILTAPTAAGKTALALELGEALGVEVVSADAFLVYRGLDIGTAKPTKAERARVPHHLIDIRDPWEDYDVAQFVADAETVIAGVRARGKLPLVVGGTGFYLSALTRGLPTTPRADPEMQREVEAELASRGLGALLADIEAARPQELARLQRNPRRVVRTLEVWRRTGRFPSEFPRAAPAFAYHTVAFSPPFEELEKRIAARVDAMFQAGWAGEVRELTRQLSAHDVTTSRPTALQAIGYAEVAAFLNGELSEEEARVAVVAATRGYARRQLTWIRTQLGAQLGAPPLPSLAAARQALLALLFG